ncbi:MAG: ABC transporter permease [Phycisphaerales bacterium]|nr:ABC transporter permease [Phycisphaerales bacterium]
MTHQAGAIPLKVSDSDGIHRAWLNPGIIGWVLLLMVALPCLLTLPWSMQYYDVQRIGGNQSLEFQPPGLQPFEPFGTDALGRSLLWRCLLGGAISLGIGLAAAGISVIIGVTFGLIAGYVGGRFDAIMMRLVDVLYGLPYILLVVLLNLTLRPVMEWLLASMFTGNTAKGLAEVVTLLLAIGGLSWLTMARVIRGQVLSLRSQPFMEAARAAGLPMIRVMVRHLLPNLIGPIVVYATLTVPTAILQESFLSFLGIGVQAPLPSWGNLASEGIPQLHSLGSGVGRLHWWLLGFPCLLLALTLLALNLLGESLRQRLDPRLKT